MRRFSIQPTLSMRGRTFKGLRGWAGKPIHPPLTDIPIGAYVLAAVFDVVSYVGGGGHVWASQFWHAATFCVIGGAGVSVLAALTGFVDAWKSSEAGTQARRTINTHAALMVTTTLLALANVGWRVSENGTHASTPVGVMILSLVVATTVSLGATFGGALVYEYGFNVETAGDHPAWHASEDDVFHDGTRGSGGVPDEGKPTSPSGVRTVGRPWKNRRPNSLHSRSA